MRPQVTDYEKRTLFPLLFFTRFVYNFVTKEWSNIIDQADYNLTTDSACSYIYICFQRSAPFWLISIGRDNFIHPYVTYQMFKLRFYYFIKNISSFYNLNIMVH